MKLTTAHTPGSPHLDSSRMAIPEAATEEVRICVDSNIGEKHLLIIEKNKSVGDIKSEFMS